MRQLAQGFAFNAKELMVNMNMKRLTFLGKDCIPYTHDKHKDEFSANVFLTHFFLVVNDIIERNVTYHIFRRTGAKGLLKTRVIRGHRFKKLYNVGFFKGLDPMKTYFTGAELVVSIYCYKKPFIQPVYLNEFVQKDLIKKLNEGKQYGDGKIETTWRDYMDKIYDKYSNIPRKDLNYIVCTGWTNFLQLKLRGADISLLQRPAKAYIGKLFKDELDHFEYYKKKMLFKMMFLDRKKHKLKLGDKWYIYLTKSQLEKLKQGTYTIQLKAYRTRELADLGTSLGTYVYSIKREEEPNIYSRNFEPEDFKNMVFECERKATTFKYIQDNLKKYKV